MRTFRYDKLVRDKIVPGMEAEGSFGNFVEVGFAVNFNIWEFPEVCVDDAGRSLANEEA